MEVTRTGCDYAPHPRAHMLPALPAKNYAALKAGIRDHGLQHPIKLLKGTHYLLDGRHRVQACRELGIEIKVEEVDILEKDVPLYTAAEAAKREGLTATQKVVLSIDLLPEFEERATERQNLGAELPQGAEKGRATALAASLVGVSETYVKQGYKLSKQDPELYELMRQGEMTLAQAQGEAKREMYKAGGKEKPKAAPRCKECKDGRFLVPEYLRDRLAAAADVVGGHDLGEGVEALLDFIDGEGSAAWASWAEAQKAAGQ